MTKYTMGGYKYRLDEDLVLQSSILGYVVNLPFIKLSFRGMLIVKHGYACDGPSGPTFDMWRPKKLFKWLYKKFIIPSIGHDAEYQLIRMEELPLECRENADQDIRTWCLDRKMWKPRANWIYKGVSKAAGFAADPSRRRKIYEAL